MQNTKHKQPSTTLILNAAFCEQLCIFGFVQQVTRIYQIKIHYY